MFLFSRSTALLCFFFSAVLILLGALPRSHCQALSSANRLSDHYELNLGAQALGSEYNSDLQADVPLESEENLVDESDYEIAQPGWGGGYGRGWGGGYGGGRWGGGYGGYGGWRGGWGGRGYGGGYGRGWGWGSGGRRW